MKMMPRFSVEMELYDILYLSYLIPASRIRPLVPDILPLATMSGNRVFFSVVTFHSTGVRLVSLPSLRFAYDQINLRTYVTDPYTGNHGVYFFRSGITSATTSFFTRLLKLPWENISFAVRAERGEGKHYTRYIASGQWHGELYIEVTEEGSQIKDFQPFANQEEAIQYLTGPSIGFYVSSGKTHRFEVRHSHIQPRSGKVLKVNFPFLATLKLLEEREIQQPHTLLLAPHGQFLVSLPPLLMKL
jgi:hypothetical protein